jgi:hypothetical protein
LGKLVRRGRQLSGISIRPSIIGESTSIDPQKLYSSPQQVSASPANVRSLQCLHTLREPLRESRMRKMKNEEDEE